MSAPRLVPVENPLVRVQLFGANDARSYHGENVLPRGLRARAILAYLLLSPDDAIPRKRFLSLLWSQRFEEQARQSSRQSVRELTVALARVQPKILDVTRDTIRLDRTRVWIEGLSHRATGETPDAIGFDPATFLETLLGLDPNFDAWIDEMRASLQVRGAPPPTAVVADPIDTQRTGVLAVRPNASWFPAARPTAKRSPRVDVMPFAAFGADAANAHMAPALSHELATGLARFRWISVRLLHTAGATPLPDYRLEGHIAHAPSGGRLTVRLVDRSDADAIVWTHSEDIRTSIRPSIVAELAERVVARLDPEILAIETRKVAHGPAVADDAYGLFLQALQKLHTFESGDWQTAMTSLERALMIDARFGRAQALLALCRLTGLIQGWLPMSPDEVAQIDRLTVQATANDPHDSLGLALAGHIRAFLHRDFDGAKHLFARAIETNPHCGFAWGYSCLTFAYTGATKEAWRRYHRAARSLVHEPFNAMLDAFRSAIHFSEKDWPATIVASRNGLQRMPAFSNVRKILIEALCMEERWSQARIEHDILLAMEPQFEWRRHLETYPFVCQTDRDVVWRALFKAGLLEEERATVTLNKRHQFHASTG